VATRQQTPAGTRAGTAPATTQLLREYARTRDVRLRNRIVQQHEQLVHYVAQRFAPTSRELLEDLTQVACLALISAVERFDPDRGASFVTYAVPTMVGKVKHYLRDHTWDIKVPRRLRECGVQVRNLSYQLEQALGRAPTVEEVAAATGLSEERLLESMELERFYSTTSLDAHLGFDGAEGDHCHLDMAGRTDENISQVEERTTIAQALAHLDSRERTILESRYYQEATQSEVGQRLGISQMHVSRLERRALQRVRELLCGAR